MVSLSNTSKRARCPKTFWNLEHASSGLLALGIHVEVALQMIVLNLHPIVDPLGSVRKVVERRSGEAKTGEEAEFTCCK